MERFAIKIDKKLKANLYKICRLCGIDNPDMVPIITDKQTDNQNVCIDVEAEMEMPQKINLLIGLSITKDDRMPQTMCCLCVDKINDFYEFREMCYATNSQTRKLLGLKNIKKSSLDIKPKVEVKEELVISTSTTTPAVTKHANRKRKSEELALKEEMPEAFAAVSKKKLRFSLPAESSVKEETPVQTKKKLRFTGMVEEPMPPIVGNSKKSKINTIEDTKLKKEPSPPVLIPPLAVSNKKLRLAPLSQKESATKKSKQKGVKGAEQKEADVKEEIKEEIKEELASIPPTPKPASAPPAPKLKFGCNICKERFPAKINLEAHTRTTHIPKIERYVCTACNEVLSKSFDIKNHQLWHKLSKTPYICGCCGETILNTYAFTRHLREHAFETPPALLVFDRECPQCHTSYATNFLYNIHICAVKTKRCAGCNRLQRNDAEYLKHSAHCAKVYLNYSKHIMPSVQALEDSVRIKNENDVEAAAEEMARISGVPLDMAPVVQLTRLSSPLIMAASHCVSLAGFDDAASSSSKKSGKKGVSKKNLKRVDELLKSTLDALVSIKHEPEMHVDEETPCAGEHSDNEDHHGANSPSDFHLNETDDVNAITKVGNTTKISPAMESGQEEVKIKQEIDETNEENASKIGGGLKLKIKMEHGQLNSSIIEQQKSSEKRAEKRKKKKKHKEKEKDKQKLSKDMQDEQISQDSNANNNHNSEMAIENTSIRIKAEPQDDNEASALHIRPQPEATIMTSIPMMQFQIACVSSGVEFNNGTNNDAVVDSHQEIASASASQEAEPEDVKPNREELDRMLKISHVSSGIAMETEENVDQQMDHDDSCDKGNGANVGINIYYEGGNEDNRGRDNEFEHPDEEQEPEDKIENDVGQSSEDTLANNNMKKKKLSLQPKHKLNLKPKDKPLPIITKSRNKACKSTAKPPNMPILQISAVQSGVTLEPSASDASDFIPIYIKAEPQNRGYSDEQRPVEVTPPLNKTQSDEPVELSLTHSDEEQNYISSIDFNNITIKQEKDIEINDVQIVQKSIKSFTELNGIKRKRKQVLRSHYVKDKTLLLQDRNENMEDEEEHTTDIDDEDEEQNFEDELEDEEEDEGEEEEDEDEDEEEDEEEVEEREYRELEYPPELIENKTALNTEEYNTQANENANETVGEKLEDGIKGDTPKDDNIAFVIANVRSQATTEVSDVDVSNSNIVTVVNTQVLANHDNNISTPATVTDRDDFKVAPKSESKTLEETNADILCCTTNKEDYVKDSSITILSTEISNVIVPQKDDIILTLSTKASQENNQHQTVSVGRQSRDDLHSALQTSQSTENSPEKLQNQGNYTQYKLQENMGIEDIEMKRESNITHAQNILQHTKSGVQTDLEHRLDAKDMNQKQQIVQNTVECSQEMESEKHPNEFEAQTSQHLQPIFETGCVRTSILNDCSALNNNPPINCDSLQISKDNQAETATIEGIVQQPKDVYLEAHPVANKSVHDDDEAQNEVEFEEEDNNNIDETTLDYNLEEQQNYQNQEVLSQIRPTALELHPYLEDISSSSNSFLSNSLSQTPPLALQPVSSMACVGGDFNTQTQEQQRLLNTEETENILNESNDVLNRRSLEEAVTSASSVGQLLTQPNLGQQLPPHMPTFNFDNINEIAENNNNANIEREQLQDGQQHQQHQQN